MKPGIRRLMEDLRGARVLVVHPRDAEGDALIDQLKRIGCNVRGLWPPPAEIPRAAIRAGSSQSRIAKVWPPRMSAEATPSTVASSGCTTRVR